MLISDLKKPTLNSEYYKQIKKKRNYLIIDEIKSFILKEKNWKENCVYI